MIPFISISMKGKNIVSENTPMVSRGQAWQGGCFVQKAWRSLWGNGNVPFMIVVMVTWLHTFVKTHWNVHSKLMNCILC